MSSAASDVYKRQKLTCDNGVITLVVRDDGKGFERTRIPRQIRPTWGLMGMEERTGLCGGEFSLKSAPGWGTEIQVVIPCDEMIVEEEERDENQIVISG